MNPNEGETIIGREIHFRGEVSGSADLIIDGELDGTIRLSGARLTIRAEGRVRASISAQEVIIAGRVEGEIRAPGRVELRDGSVVLGDVCTAHLSIEEGATVRGAVDPGRANQAFPEATDGSRIHRE
ncbi:MAG: bactofilin family protein [Acidobacteriaceae bacterium]